MSKTQDELVAEVLLQLGAIQAGEEPSVEDVSAIEGRIQPMLDKLALRKVIYVPDPDDVDDAVFLPLARLIAQDVAPGYGKARDLSEMRLAEYELRSIQPVTPLARQEGVYF